MRVTDAPEGTREQGAWSRLRSRKVVQWSLAYVAGAWALLQGVDFLADAFDWPASSKRVATFVSLIGLPMAIVVAWYHGERGQQRVTLPEVALLGILCLLGGAGLWFYEGQGERTDIATQSVPSAANVPANPAAQYGQPSLAVLPFENRSKLEDDVFFVDGIHDDILTQLSKIGSLTVIARTSVERFRGTTLPVRAIADQLGVTAILEGGVQRAGERVRVNVQLIDARTEGHLWAETYDRELKSRLRLPRRCRPRSVPPRRSGWRVLRRSGSRHGRLISSVDSDSRDARAARWPRPRTTSGEPSSSIRHSPWPTSARPRR